MSWKSFAIKIDATAAHGAFDVKRLQSGNTQMFGWFVLVIAAIVAQWWLRSRLRDLGDTLARQQRAIEGLTRRLEAAERAGIRAPEAAPEVKPALSAAAPPTSPTPAAPPAAAAPPPPAPVEKPKVAPPPILVQPAPVPRPAAADLGRPPVAAREAAAMSSGPAAGAQLPPLAPPVAPPPSPPPPPRVPFDWESLVGVKLFSAIAGIALVLAAVFFLRYSIDRGWLSPPVRVAIGIIVAVALLVVCELRAARKYAVTANALDAAAIAILFATFFAAHTLWGLIPAPVTFGLLAMVTVLAVLLSIRRDSMFIAVLGLLGGFATPALLSTGENQPIPLFAYLLLLNVGLAWVASRRRWPVLSILTLVLTALYQWTWVITFLTSSQLSLAMGIFLVFSVASFLALTFRARSAAEPQVENALDHSSLGASAMPLLFAVYVAAVPGYGAQAGLLFGFLLLIDAALLAIAIARRVDQLHVSGAAATLLVFATWLARSYGP